MLPTAYHWFFYLLSIIQAAHGACGIGCLPRELYGELAIGSWPDM